MFELILHVISSVLFYIKVTNLVKLRKFYYVCSLNCNYEKYIGTFRGTNYKENGDGQPMVVV